MKESVKGLADLVSDKNIEEAQKSLPKAYKAIDKAAKRGIIKKNTAARRKSRLAKLVNKVN
jgi:small subunit ribosomal protein S20